MEWKWLHCSAVQDYLPNVFNLCFTVTRSFPLLFQSLSCFYSLLPSLFVLATTCTRFSLQYKYPERDGVWCFESRLFFHFCGTPKKMCWFLFFFAVSSRTLNIRKDFLTPNEKNDYLITGMKLLSESFFSSRHIWKSEMGWTNEEEVECEQKRFFNLYHFNLVWHSG